MYLIIAEIFLTLYHQLLDQVPTQVYQILIFYIVIFKKKFLINNFNIGFRWTFWEFRLSRHILL